MADSIYEGGPSGGITIGNPISGGTANSILFEDASNNLAESVSLLWDESSKSLQIGSGTDSIFSFDTTNKVLSLGLGTGMYLYGVYAPGSSQYWGLRGGNTVGGMLMDNENNIAYFFDGSSNRSLEIDYANSTYKFGNVSGAGNDTLITVDDSGANKKVTSTGVELIAGPINSTHAPTSDPIAMGGTFTGVVTTTYTITVNTGTTFDWTDGTNSGTNVAMDFGSPNVLSQGVTVFFVGGSYTPTEYWTQTYTATVVSRLILDYKNKSYSIGNAGTSGARARIITDGTSNAKVGTYATNYTAEISTDTSSVGFLYSDGTYSGGFGISGSQASFAISNSASDQSKLDFRPTFALFYTQDGGSGYYTGVKTTTTSVKVGDFDLIANSTFLTVDDNAKTITAAGGIIYKYTSKTANYTIDRGDYMVECTANTFNITLPTAVGFTGQVFNVKNTGAGTITMLTTSGQTIDGAASGTLFIYTNENYQFMSNGANRIIL